MQPWCSQCMCISALKVASRVHEDCPTHALQFPSSTMLASMAAELLSRHIKLGCRSSLTSASLLGWGKKPCTLPAPFQALCNLTCCRQCTKSAGESPDKAFLCTFPATKSAVSHHGCRSGTLESNLSTTDSRDGSQTVRQLNV